MTSKTTDAITSIEWKMNDQDDGYEVRTHFAGGDCDLYCAGDHPDVSDAYLPVTDPRALGLSTLRKFARQTAMEQATALGVSVNLVSEER